MAMVMVDLGTEAAAEASRVARARALTRDDDARVLAQLEAGGAWIAQARRTRTRQALGARLVLVWRVAVEDAGGRLVEWSLVPAAADVGRDTRCRLTRPWLKTLVSTLERETPPEVERATAEWQQTAEQAVSRFASMRMAREHAIASWLSTSGTDDRLYQPGLFDRRVEHERRRHAAAGADAEHDAVGRLMQAERFADVRRRRPQLVLALVP